MTSRVTLISPATNAALREARFDDGCSLDAAGAARARSAAGGLRPAGHALASPTVRCGETASALGLAADTETALAGLDMGRWRGRTLGDVSADEPEAVAMWLTDPTASPHGGESVRRLCERVGAWLDAAAEFGGRTVAVVEPEIVRAVTVRVLGAPEAAFWRIDVPPLTATEFSGRAGRWNLVLGAALGRG
ncbi:histidine phosphatase family protein [Streptomyces yaanensis]|uniref:Histidine phosphatase family protein n=1 Tax=Streptomyces yaanensis TaxID=1142239 RepID=A0ABV7SAU3_9ACTN|nr:histidine phosphatase family protein [Streptomyces sp. CGMCC 4.7035]WNB96703.1 histidine phosphatase family protein [Streptomyces sp. CGMCC 4.7035]